MRRSNATTGCVVEGLMGQGSADTARRRSSGLTFVSRTRNTAASTSNSAHSSGSIVNTANLTTTSTITNSTLTPSCSSSFATALSSGIDTSELNAAAKPFNVNTSLLSSDSIVDSAAIYSSSLPLNA